MEEIGNSIPNKVTGDKLTANEVNILKNKADELVSDSNAKTLSVSELESDVADIFTDIGNLETETATVKNDIVSLRSDITALSGSGTIKVVKSDTKIWVRTSYSDTEDLVQEMDLRNANNISNIGTGKLVLKEQLHTATGTVLSNANDNTAPLQYTNIGSIGGNHGFPVINFNSAGHGKTSADISSIWSDGTYQYYIAEIVTADQIRLMGKAYVLGSENAYRTGSVNSLTLTHVSGATNTATLTGTGSGGTQAFPTTKGTPLVELLVNGELITDNGEYVGDKVELINEYEVADPTEVIPENPWNYASGPAIAKVRVNHKFAENGCMVLEFTIDNKIQHRVRNMGLIQNQPISLGNGATIREFYIPGVLPVTWEATEYNFQNREDATGTYPNITLYKADNIDITKPADRHIQLALNAEGETLYTQTSGYLPYGTGRDIQRQDNADVYFISSAKKLYPRLYSNNRLSDLKLFYASAYYMYFNPTLNPELTAYYAVPFGEEWLIFIDSHQSLSKYNVRIDDFLINNEVEVIETGGTIEVITDDFIPAGGLIINVTNFGYAVLKTKNYKKNKSGQYWLFSNDPAPDPDPEPDIAPETAAYIARVTADGGKILDETRLNNFIKENKTLGLYNSLQFAASKQFGYKLTGTDIIKIYDVSKNENDVTIFAGTLAEHLANPMFYFGNNGFKRDAATADVIGTKFTFTTRINHPAPDSNARNFIFGIGDVNFFVGGNANSDMNIGYQLASSGTTTLRSAQGSYNNANDANVDRQIDMRFETGVSQIIRKDGVDQGSLTNTISGITLSSAVTKVVLGANIAESIPVGSDANQNNIYFYNDYLTDQELTTINSI